MVTAKRWQFLSVRHGKSQEAAARSSDPRLRTPGTFAGDAETSGHIWATFIARGGWYAFAVRGFTVLMLVGWLSLAAVALIGLFR